MKTAAIVPAYNEQDRVGTVLEAIREATLIDEVLVVNDGSTDATSEVVSRVPNVRLVEMGSNGGKGAAMRMGAASTDADIVLFLDADLAGMTGQKVDAIVQPVLDGQADMSIGIFRGGRRSTDVAQVIAPYISGQRALHREVFLSIPNIDRARSGVETAITRYYRMRGLRVTRVALAGCTHCMKEEKLGFVRGFFSRLRMYKEIAQIILDGRSFKSH